MQVNQIALGVSEYRGFARLRNVPRSLIGWNRINRLNSPALENLLGPLAKRELAGVAGAVAMEDPEKQTAEQDERRKMIAKLGNEIKEQVRNKDLQRSGRATLAGRTASFAEQLAREDPGLRCQTGVHRCSLLDEAVKKMAAGSREDSDSSPNSGSQLLRQTKFF